MIMSIPSLLRDHNHNTMLIVVSLLILHLTSAVCPDGVQKVIIDADTAMFATVGLDIDDDLAVAYLVAQPCVEILGVTVTHGNAIISTTCPLAKQLINELYSPTDQHPPVVCGTG